MIAKILGEGYLFKKLGVPASFKVSDYLATVIIKLKYQ
jgi:hypothetical protein